jgi:hypothetical protein
MCRREIRLHAQGPGQQRNRFARAVMIVKEVSEGMQQSRIVLCQTQRGAKLRFDPLRFADAVEDGGQIAARVFRVASIARGAVQQLGGVFRVTSGTGRQAAEKVSFDIVRIARA